MLARATVLACGTSLLAACIAPYAFVQPDAVGSGGYYTGDYSYAAPGYYTGYGYGYYGGAPYYPAGYGYYGYGPTIGLSVGYSSGWGGYPRYRAYGNRSGYWHHAGCYDRHCGGTYRGRGYGHGDRDGGYGAWSHRGESWSTESRGPAPPRIVQPPAGSRYFQAPVSTGRFTPPARRIIPMQAAPPVRPARGPREPDVQTK